LREHGSSLDRELMKSGLSWLSFSDEQQKRIGLF